MADLRHRLCVVLFSSLYIMISASREESAEDRGDRELDGEQRCDLDRYSVGDMNHIIDS
jgi:hypothetical protein